MDSGLNKTALITGASAGIGYELAKLFAEGGYNLVLIARREDKLRTLAEELEQTQGISVHILSKDLTDKQAPQHIFETVQEQNIHVDVLVNNAGFGVHGLFAETEWQEEQDMITVNMTALTQLTKLFLPAMVEKKQGKIMNIASTAAFQPGPVMAIYFASKAYVLSFSEALANELIGTGVTVTALCPGPTRTEFQMRAKIEKSRLFRSGNVMDVQTVARTGYRGLMSGKTVVIPGIQNKVMVQLQRLTPRKLITKVVRKLQESTQSQED